MAKTEDKPITDKCILCGKPDSNRVSVKIEGKKETMFLPVCAQCIARPYSAPLPFPRGHGATLPEREVIDE